MEIHLRGVWMGDNSKINVLIVDDEILVTLSLAEFLNDFDFSAQAVDSGEKALKFLEKQVCDVVIVDLRLYGMDGEEMILDIHSQYPSAKFIVYTGSIDYALSEDLRKVGITEDFVFFKPQEDLRVFVDAINKLMKK